MRRRPARRVRFVTCVLAALSLAWIAVLAGCARRAGPPAIAVGAPCAACGMTIEDLRFACERRVGDRWRAYDSIECLLRDGGASAADPGGRGPEARGGANAYLADYDRQSLHAVDSLWVVKGSFASPMGGGLAAFLERSAADSIAARTEGRVTRFAALMEGSAR